MVLAEASQLAIEKVTSVIGDNDRPVMYLLGERYVAALQDLSASNNGKFIVVPADLQAAVKGMMGGAK